MLNISEIETFLKFLSPTDPFFTFAFLGAGKSDGVLPGYATVQASIAEICHTCQTFWDTSRAFTLHTTLNQCDDKGRKLANVQGARVLCVDLDRQIDINELETIKSSYYPQMIVTSSPGKYHLYWKVSPTVSLDAWSFYQLGLSQIFGSDRTLAQKNKTIRVPGVPRVLTGSQQFTPSIVYLVEDPKELDEEAIRLIFPTIGDEYQEALEEIKLERQTLAKLYKDKAKDSDWTKLSSKTGRNNTLYAAVRLHVLRSDAVTWEEALAFAESINAKFAEALEQHEVESCTRSALVNGMEAKERKVKAVTAAQEKLVEQLVVHTEPVVEPTEPTDVEDAPQILNETLPIPAFDRYTPFTSINYKTPALIAGRFSEIGVAERALQRFRDKMILIGRDLYAFDTGDKIWCRQMGDSHRQLNEFAYFASLDTLIDPEFAKNFARGEDGDISPQKLKKAHERFLGIGLVNKVSSFLLQSTGVMKGNHATFDAKEHLIYCSNGVLDMSSLELREARGDDYLLASTPVYWPSGAENADTMDFSNYCPQWLTFLWEVFEGNEELVSFIQELFGYSVSGSIAEQKIFCHYGDGSNGKSKLLAVLSQLSGGYGTYVDPDDMVTNKTGFVKAFERFGSKIEGRRCVIVDDIDVKTVWNESFVKNVTGDQIRARAEHEKSRLVANRAKIHLGLNVPPTPQAENYGLLRRLCLIPYNVRFIPNAAKSVELDLAFKDELPWIFAWAVAGYRRRMARGMINYPQELDLAVEEYKANNFPVERLLRENFVVGNPESDKDYISLKDLASALVDLHSGDTGERLEISSNSLGRTVRLIFGINSVTKRTITGVSKSVPLVRKAVG